MNQNDIVLVIEIKTTIKHHQIPPGAYRLVTWTKPEMQ